MNSQTVLNASTSNSNSNSSTSSNSNSSNTNSSDSQSDSRLTVADILSSMANGEIITTSYTTLDGFSTGIPTRTTPTLTPTTLRNIEQTFIELQSVPPPMHHQHQAGFVPPIVHTNSTTNTTSQSPTFQNAAVKEENIWLTCPGSGVTKMSSKTVPIRQSNIVSTTSSMNSTHMTPKSSGRHMGGRRPNKDEKLSPEEEERRRVRRERNKLAAARCRKRRMDHTNCLLTETEGLEDKKQSLQKEISELQNQKEHLEFILEAHRCLCKNGKLLHRSSEHMKDVIVTSADSVTPSTTATVPTTFSDSELPRKPLARPTSLPISCSFTIPTSSNIKQNTSSSEVAGIPISTPSSGIFNFDALMEGGTGLTPVSMAFTPVIPTCSSQQRNSGCDLSSPDNMNPPKLVSL